VFLVATIWVAIVMLQQVWDLYQLEEVVVGG
jgi:hypothetical protein